MADSFTTHKVFLESADFSVLILEYPNEEINDRLAMLAPDKGLIYKTIYEDFVMSSCLVNAGHFFYHVKKRAELVTKYAEIKEEILATIFRYSPGFLPENVVVNSNNLFKLKSTLQEDETHRPLVDNELWDEDPPLSGMGPVTIASAPSGRDEEDEGYLEEDGPEPPAENPFDDAGGSGDDVPYELIGHKWDTPALHINVRQYESSEEAKVVLLGGAPFETTRGYHLLITQLCIEDFSDVFRLLDKMGVTKRNTPAKLLEELYEISVSYNPFLKLEDVNLKEIRSKYKAMDKRGRHMSAGQSPGKKVKRRGKRFSEVPEEKLLNLAVALKDNIVGQDEALEVVADAVMRASVGLKEPEEPLGAFLFTGTTGVGKTETAKVLAKELGAHLIRIDCQEYQQPHEAVKLTGSPPGYIGHDAGGQLTNEISKYPFSVVLFDEIEKAHSNFHERVLQILDDGILTDSSTGNKVPFNESIIIMTSNIGVKEVDKLNNRMGIGSVTAVTQEESSGARERALKKKFKPEFINRIDEIVHFNLLDRDNYLHILDILLGRVQNQIGNSRGVALKFNEGAKNFLLDSGVDKKYGARPMKRAIKKHLNTPLARAVIRKEVDGNSKVVVSLKPSRDGLTFRNETRRKAKDAVQ